MMNTYLWVQKGSEQESSKLYIDGKSYSEGHPDYANLYWQFHKQVNNTRWDYNQQGTKVAVGLNKVVVSAHFEQKDNKGRNIVFTFSQQGKGNVTANILAAGNHSYTLSSETSKTIDAQVRAIGNKQHKKLLLLGCAAIVIAGVLCIINQCR